MFVWAPIPEPWRALGSLAFSKLLLEEAKVAVSPGIGFGEYGEGYVRLALVENRQRIRQAVRNIKSFLGAASRSSGRGRWPELMTEPLRLGIAGLGTVGAAVLKLLEQNGALLAERAGRELQVVAVSARRPAARARRRPRAVPLVRRSAGAGRGPRGRAAGRADRRRRRAGAGALPGGAGRRQARGHRQQGAARPSWRRARRAWPTPTA